MIFKHRRRILNLEKQAAAVEKQAAAAADDEQRLLREARKHEKKLKKLRDEIASVKRRRPGRDQRPRSPWDGLYDIPKDKNYPRGAAQCHGCGGLGCAVCGGRGWLIGSAKVLNGRRCANADCGKFLQPDCYPVYCSNECALADS